ncbi:MAG: PQQ-binding-like beta-propeller repeat protein [Ktedonobacteraceae bacterium]|nr:PQQ-binding-like beta-propeller repeat protein [Ktedonobacteraceae bacterium]
MMYVKKRQIWMWLALLVSVSIVSYMLIGQNVFSGHAKGVHGKRHRVVSPGDWTMFQGTPDHSGYNSVETVITPATAPHLKVHWTVSAGADIDSQIIAANGLLYWGSWDGLEHASDLSGNTVWTQYLGVSSPPHCDPPSTGVASTAAAASVSINGTQTAVVFVGGGDAAFYALDAKSGQVLWRTPLGIPPAYFLCGSPVVYNGSIYEGVSSYGDCPLVQGELVKMNASTGTIQQIFYTMPAGCKGAGVWDTPSIDEVAKTVYFGTSNAGVCKKPGQYDWSMIEVNASDLSLVHSWRLPRADQTNNADFGLAAPMLFTATIKGVVHNMVGAPNQNGKYYAFDRANISNGPVWQVRLATPGRGSISSSAWDGTTIYAAGTDITIKGTSCQGSAAALNPATGKFIWQKCWTAGRVLNAVMAVPGLIVVGQGRYVNVLSATTGQTLYRYINTAKDAVFHGAPTISNGVLYIGNQDGELFAFGL